MQTILLFVVVFGFLSIPPSQVNFESMIRLLVARYGGAAVEAVNAEASGLISYSRGDGAAFTLTAQKNSLRFAIQKSNETKTIIRQDGRSQVSRGGKTDYPAQSPRSLSALNLLPIHALITFRDDPRFTGSLIQAADGSIGIRFAEQTPPGFKPPPFPQPMMAVTFRLDTLGRIALVSYDDGREGAPVITYQYLYESSVPGAFLAPSTITFAAGMRRLWTATITGTRNNVSLPDDFFKILETYERIGR